MGKYSTYLELNRSQDAPKHCPTFDSLTQCFASAHFRSPPVRLQFCSIDMKYSFTAGKKSVMEYGIWQTKLEVHWRRTGGALEAT